MLTILAVDQAGPLSMELSLRLRMGTVNHLTELKPKMVA